MTTPLGGLPYPADITTPPNGPLQIANLAKAVQSRMVNRFASNAARDSAYAAWVAEGNTMTDGLECTVAGWPQVYRSAKWRGVGNGPIYTGVGPGTFGPYTTPVGDTTARVLGRVTISDPGYEYRVRVFASVDAYATDSAGNAVTTTAYRVDSYISSAGTFHDFWPGSNGGTHKHADLSPNTMTGSQIINLEAYRPFGASGYWVSESTNFLFRVEVVPV